MSVRVRHKGQVTFPASVRHEAQIEEGDCLDFIVRGKGEVLVLLVPNGNGNGNGAHYADADIELPPEMVERIDRALAELDAGLVTRFGNEDDFLSSLDD